MDQVSFAHPSQGMKGDISPIRQGTNDRAGFAFTVAKPILSLVAVDGKWIFKAFFHKKKVNNQKYVTKGYLPKVTYQRSQT